MLKKGFAINEVVQLPKTNSPATVCVIATGDMSQKAKAANADSVVGNEELEKFELTKENQENSLTNMISFWQIQKLCQQLVKH